MKPVTLSIQTHLSLFSREYPMERFLRRWGIVGLFLATALYIYFVSASVFLVIERKEANLHTEYLSSATATLERDLFTKIETLTPVSGSAMGLFPVKKTVYLKDNFPFVEAGTTETQGL